AVSPLAAPLYGTWVSFTPSRSATISMTRCVEFPLPADEKFSCPGLALACAARSAIDLMPDSGLATRRNGVLTSSATPSKSFSGLYGRDLYVNGLKAR